MNKHELVKLLEKVQKREVHYIDAEYMIDEKKSEYNVEAEGNEKNKIAVIGYSCRFPQADNADEFWNNILHGRDCITEIPKERWELDGFYDKNSDNNSETSYSKWGGFLGSLSHYDTAFLGMDKEELLTIDPQQLIIMEVVWEALEHAGYGNIRRENSDTGIFIGARANNCTLGMLDKNNTDLMEGSNRNYIIGKAPNMIAARLSDFLNLKGPSMVMDTACSSSLVSIHTACRSILAGDCTMALAGGIDLLVNSDSYVGLSKAKAISPDGKCYTFDKRANGYVPGEGAGIVILKEYSKAVADGDTIYGVIAGSSVNNDGHTMGITTPDLNGQKNLIKKALKNAKVSPENITYIEAHGTGTAIGDPIEVKALTETFRESTSRRGFCAIGSVKTNIGHLHSAAGIAGFIKILLCIKNKTLVPTLNCDIPNPRFNFVDSPFFPITKPVTWDNYGDKRRAAISSFGFGGTNCHIIIEEHNDFQVGEQEQQRYLPFVLSALNREALDGLIKEYISFLKKNKQLRYKDAAFVANAGRQAFSNKLFINASNIQELIAKLEDAEKGIIDEKKSIFVGDKAKKAGNKLVLMFTGQGSLYTGAAKEIYDTNSLFKKTLDKCSDILMPYLGKSINELLFNPENTKLLSSTYITQPVTFALDYSLYILWRHLGLTPSVVIGHSLGEYVAACAAGVMDLEAALKLVVTRGKLMSELPENGAMAAVFTYENEVNQLLSELSYQERAVVSIAAVNGETNTVISGDKLVVDKVCRRFKEKSVKSVLLQVSHAFHSPQMESMLDKYREALRYIKPNKAQFKIVSNVTGDFIDGEALTEEYWLSHIMGTVQFNKSIKKLLSEGYKYFIELGPGTTLSQLTSKIAEGYNDITVAATLTRGKSDWLQLFDSMGKLNISGAEFDLTQFFQSVGAKRIALPLYSFTREEVINSNKDLTISCVSNETNIEFFDGILSKTEQYVSFYKILNADRDAVLRDHVVGGNCVVSGVYQIKLAAMGVQKLWNRDIKAIEDIRFSEPIIAAKDKNLLIRVRIFKDNNNHFRIDRWDETLTNFIECSGGQYSFENEPIKSKDDYENCADENQVTLEADKIYEYMDSVGLHYGPLYRGINKIVSGSNTALGELKLTIEDSTDCSKVFHPGVVDSALQVVSAILFKNNIKDKYVPFCISKISVFGKMLDTNYKSKVKIYSDSNSTEILKADVILTDNNGQVIMKFNGVHFKKIEKNGSCHNLLFKPTWIEKPLLRIETTGIHKNVLIFMDEDNQQHNNIAEEIKSSGFDVYKVYRSNRNLNNDGHSFNVTQGEYSDLVLVLNKLQQKSLQLHNVLYLWSLDDYNRVEQATGDINLNKHSLALDIIYLLRAIKENKINSKFKLITVTNNCQPALRGKDVLFPEKSEVLGVIKTIPLEFEQVQAVNIDFDCQDFKTQSISRSILTELSVIDKDAFIAYRNAKRFVMVIEKVKELKQDAINEITVRKGGTYIVLGGQGGLGVEIIKHLADKEQANFIVISRSEFPDVNQWGKLQNSQDLMNSRIKDNISAFKEVLAKGSRLAFYKADITDYDSLKAVFDEVRHKFGSINGIIHAAGILQDALILNMDSEKFYSVLKPKMLGTVFADKLTENDPVDFMILFSGFVSYVGIMGQSNHTSANFFEDSFTYYRNFVKRKRTLTINWGIWGTIGIVAKPMYIQSLKEKGFSPMEVKEALDAFDKVISTDMPQVGIGHMSGEKQAKLLYREGKRVDSGYSLSDEASCVGNILKHDIELDRLIKEVNQSYEFNFGRDLDILCAVFVMDYFKAYGIFVEQDVYHTADNIRTTCKILPKFDRLVDAMLAILLKMDFIQAEGSKKFKGKGNIGYNSFNILSQQFKENYKNEDIYAIILDNCYSKYGEVLSGQLNAMSVLFPGGNINIMEKLYHLPSPQNHYIGKVVKSIISSHAPGKKVKILEIGGGTGGSTAKILKEINGLDVEYTFTDISPVLLKHASESFKEYTFVNYTQLDIEKEPYMQKLQKESFDIIIAANVLHATASLSNTFNNVMKVMKSNAVVVMLETTMITGFADLVFGLTEGWWKFEDADLRKNSTLLTPYEWRTCLNKLGFSRISTLPLKDRKSVRYPYSIIIAEGIKEKVDSISNTSQANHMVKPAERVKTIPIAQKTKALPQKEGISYDSVLEFTKETIILKILEVSGIEKSSVDSDVGFLELGLDSLSLVALSGIIEKEIEISLYPTVFFEYQTIDALAAYLCEKHFNSIAKFINSNKEITVVEDAEITAEEVIELSEAAVIKEEYRQEIPEAVIPYYSEKDIAIVGMAGIFPGADDVYKLWDNLIKGVSSIKDISIERWNDSEVYSSIPDKDKTYCKWAGLIENFDKFDPQFFNISVREAKRMDPQQRLFLETAWSAIENGGYTAKRLSDFRVGVFAGVSNHNYHNISYDRNDSFCTLSTSNAMVANRLSYFMNFTGPSLTIDTQCSSSMVALNYACQSILSGECEMAIAGGVNVIIPKEYYVLLSQVKAISPDGKCKTFDKTANGFISGEGSTALLLKPLSKALKDNDNIHAVIKSVAVTHDGKSSNTSAPNANSQYMAITEGMMKADINPETLSFIEAHGTGTSLGDPVEVSALTKSFEKFTDKKSFCAIGSLKTNIGHLESTAGIAGIIKAVLAIKNRIIPPTINFNQPNSYINFNETPFYIADRPIAWKSNELMRAGISSFGMGGTNCHTIIEEAPKLSMERIPGHPEVPFNLFTISAKSQHSLKLTMEKICNYIGNNLHLNLEDICHTMSVNRNHFSNRLSIVANSTEKLYKLMKEVLKNDFTVRQQSSAAINYSLVTAETSRYKKAKVVYLISDRTFEVNNIETISKNVMFKETVEYIKALLGLDEINSTSTINKALQEVIALALQVSMAKILMDFNVNAAVVVSAEKTGLPARVLSGRISLKEAISEIAYKHGIDINEAVEIQYMKFPETQIVEFDAIKDLYQSGEEQDTKVVTIELGPDDFYTDSILENVSSDGTSINILPFFQTGATEWYSIISLIGRIYTLGVDVDFEKFSCLFNGKTLDLPTYVFDNKSYWAINTEPKAEVKSFERPYTLKGLTATNRIVKSAIEIGMADKDGLITENYINKYKSWSSIGSGIKIIGNCIVDLKGRKNGNEVVLNSVNNQTYQLKRLSELLKSDGSLLLVQLNHGGVKSIDKLSEEEINELAGRFIEAAVAAKNGGADGIQLHAAHGYLLSNFLSPLLNTRSDNWGGCTKNRTALIISIADGIRKTLGDDFIIGIKIDMPSGKNGIDIEELVNIIKTLEDNRFDIVELSGGILSREEVLKSCYLPEYKKILATIKETAGIPIIITGGIRTLEQIEDLLTNLFADFVGIGRPFINSSDFIKDLKANKEGACTSCSMCFYTITSGELRCVKEVKQKTFAPPQCQRYLFEQQWVKALENKEPEDKNIFKGTYALIGEDDIKLNILEEYLRHKGSTVVRVKKGLFYNAEAYGYTINYSNSEDYEKLMQDIYLKSGEKFRGVIHIPLHERNELLGSELNTDSGVFVHMYLAKAILAAKIIHSLKLISATFNGLAVPADKSVVPESALLVGLDRNIPYEVKNISSLAIDFNRDISNEDFANKLIYELSTFRSKFKEISYRNNERFIRITREFEGNINETGCSTDGGVYIITGGLSGLGAIFAEYFIRNNAKAVYLTGRRDIKELTDSKAISELEKLNNINRDIKNNTAIEYRKSDVSNPESLDSVVKEITSKHGRITGIVHCAGLVDSVNRTLRTKTYESFAKTISPKFQGTMNIGRAFMNILPDFMILCSSISGLNGKLGATLCDYAAANFYMNEYAKALAQNSGKKVVSVSWPLWEGVGLGAKKAYGGEAFSISSDMGLKIFDAVIKSKNCGNLIVLNPHKSDFSLNGLFKEEETLTFEKAADMKTSDVDKAASRESLKEYLKGLLVEFLQIEVSQISEYTNFSEYGIDSVIVADIVAVIERKYKIFLHPSIILEYPTINALTDFLMEEYRVIEAGTEISGENKHERETLSDEVKLSQQTENNETDLVRLLDNIYKGEIAVDEALKIFGGES